MSIDFNKTSTIYNELHCLSCGKEFATVNTTGLHTCDCGCVNCVDAVIDKEKRVA